MNLWRVGKCLPFSLDYVRGSENAYLTELWERMNTVPAQYINYVPPAMHYWSGVKTVVVHVTG